MCAYLPSHSYLIFFSVRRFTCLKKFKHLFICLWLHWFFYALCRLSLVVVSGVTSPVVLHRLQGMLASVVVAHGGLVAQIRDRTHVPCIGRKTLNCWTTREGPHLLFNRDKFLSSITRKRRVPCLIYFIGSVFEVLDTKWVPAYFESKQV